jgi:hypothetical protein
LVAHGLRALVCTRLHVVLGEAAPVHWGAHTNSAALAA